MSSPEPGASPTPFPFNLFELYRVHRDEIDILADEASLFILTYTNHIGTTTGEELARELNLPPDALVQKLEPLLHGRYVTEEEGVLAISPRGKKLLHELGYTPPPALPRGTPRPAPAPTMPLWIWILLALVGGSLLGLICVLLAIYLFSSGSSGAPIRTLAPLTTASPTNTPAAIVTATEPLSTPPPITPIPLVTVIPSSTFTATPTVSSTPTPTFTTTATNTPTPTFTTTFTNTPTHTATTTSTTTLTSTPSVGSLCVFVFNDLNGNGVPDNEPLLTGANIVVRNANNDIVVNSLSQSQPLCFTSLLPGSYTITETNPGGFPFSTSPNFVAVNVTLGGVALVSFGNQAAPTPTRTPTNTVTPSFTPTPTNTPTPTFTPTPTRTPTSPTATNTVTPTITLTPTPTPTISPTPTATRTPTPS